MEKLGIFAAIASACLVTPLSAQTVEWYYLVVNVKHAVDRNAKCMPLEHTNTELARPLGYTGLFNALN